MFQWLKSLFKTPQPAGSPRPIRVFRTSDPTISRSGMTVDRDAWRVVFRENQTVRLFEIQSPEVEQCMVTYRAKMKTNDLKGRAFLEMWCRLPGRGEFFSKGFHQAATGTTNWASYEIPFYLKKGQRPDLIKLNLVVEGAGEVWMKEIELLQTPLSG